MAFSALAAARAENKDDKKGPGLFDFGGWKLPVTRGRERARELAPVQLDRTPLSGARRAERVVRVRVYADRDYRHGALRWQVKVREQIDRVDAVVGPLFGVRFEIESARDWDVGHAGVGLQSVLDELRRADDAHDVDLVVGFVTPFRGVATSIHAIGMATPSSRHFVLRAMDDTEEARALGSAFEMLPASEREQLYDDRKAHKEVVVFLHEWAHALGAMHVDDPTLVMNPAYDPHQSAFTDFEKRLIETVLDRRLAARTEPFPETKELLALVASAPREEGSDADRAQLTGLLRARRDGAKTPPPPAASTALELAGAAAAEGAFSKAEALLATADRRSPQVNALLADVGAGRARAALPANAATFGVSTDAEPSYVAAYGAAIRAVEAGDADAAATAEAALAKSFPESAGREVIACERAAAAKQVVEARRRCEAALAKDRDAEVAHLVLGRLDAGAHHDADAEKHFHHVLLTDPKSEDAWRELGRFYRARRSSISLEKLEREHEALFSTPLPR